jgi:Family of unknown function (DUF6186)
MDSRTVTLAGYLLVVGAMIGLEVASRVSDVPSLRDVLGRVMRTRAGRLAVLASWAWLGLHFLAL